MARHRQLDMPAVAVAKSGWTLVVDPVLAM